MASIDLFVSIAFQLDHSVAAVAFQPFLPHCAGLWFLPIFCTLVVGVFISQANVPGVHSAWFGGDAQGAEQNRVVINPLSACHPTLLP